MFLRKRSVLSFFHILLIIALFCPVFGFSDNQSEELFSAISAEDVNRVQKILNSGRLDIAKIKYENNSPLHSVLFIERSKWNQNRQKILEMLISAGADVNEEGILDRARYIRSVTAVKTLLSNGADPNLSDWLTDLGVSTPYKANSSTDAINEMLISAGSRLTLVYKSLPTGYNTSDFFVRGDKETFNEALIRLKRELEDIALIKEKEVSFKEFKEAVYKADPELDVITTLSHYAGKGVSQVVQLFIDSGVDFNYHPFNQFIADWFSKDEQTEFLKRVRKKNLEEVMKHTVKELNFNIFQILLSTGFYNSSHFRYPTVFPNYSLFQILVSNPIWREPLFFKELLLYDSEWVKTSDAESILNDLISESRISRELSDSDIGGRKQRYLETLNILLSSGVNHRPLKPEQQEAIKKAIARSKKKSSISSCRKLFETPH